jgi:hypothetical protein
MDEEQARTPAIRVLRFWTDYMPDPAKPGELKPVDRVEWVKVGDAKGTTVSESIKRLSKPAQEALEWSVIGPAYEHWKKSQEIPETGTPLEAWPGADRNLVDALKKVNVRTVEDFVQVPDHAFAGIPIPDLRKRRKMAESFLLSQGEVSAVEAELTKRDEMIARQQRDMDEMRERLEALTAAQAEAEPKKQRKAA